MNYQTAKEIEIRIARYFGTRINVIVPNLSWGLLDHECDLAILSKSDYLTEVEIKVTRSDLIRDKDKNKWRRLPVNVMVRQIYFAIPEKLITSIDEIPDVAGVLVVDKEGYVKKLRQPKINTRAARLGPEFKFQLARLGAMRVWNLKEAILKLKNGGEK